MYSDVNEALHRLFEVVEAATDPKCTALELASKVARVDSLDRRLRKVAAQRTKKYVDTHSAVVLLGNRSVEMRARDLLKAWAPTGLLDTETNPFDLRRPLSDDASGHTRTGTA